MACCDLVAKEREREFCWFGGSCKCVGVVERDRKRERNRKGKRGRERERERERERGFLLTMAIGG